MNLSDKETNTEQLTIQLEIKNFTRAIARCAKTKIQLEHSLRGKAKFKKKSLYAENLTSQLVIKQ